MLYNTLIQNTPMTLKEKKALLKRLEQAGTTCKDCGSTYGVYSVGCSSSWMGKCGVCGEEKIVTESRDYAYFITGIRKLKLEIQNEKSNSQTKVQQIQE
jgi:hypothetical protein